MEQRVLRLALPSSSCLLCPTLRSSSSGRVVNVGLANEEGSYS